MKIAYSASILFIITILLHSHSFGQTFNPGYIVTTKQDTLKGLILDGTDEELGLSLQFKKDQAAAAETFTPANAIAFEFDYQRKFKRLSFMSTDTSRHDSISVFAKKNMDGKIAFYTWTQVNKNQSDIFLTNWDTQLTVHLSQPEKKLVLKNERQFTSESNTRNLGLLQLVKGGMAGMPGMKNTSYSEKAIRRNILSYNRAAQQTYPVTIYKPRKGHAYEATLGWDLMSGPDSKSFRGSFMRHTFNPERTNTVSFVMAFIYKSRSGINTYLAIANKATPDHIVTNYKEQTLSFIPLGVHLHGGSKKIRPFAYAGLGMSYTFRESSSTKNGLDQGTTHDRMPAGAFNMGAGAKIKVGRSQFLVLDFTPVFGDGLYLNLGYSF